jgi:hypothetical protein
LQNAHIIIGRRFFQEKRERIAVHHFEPVFAFEPHDDRRFADRRPTILRRPVAAFGFAAVSKYRIREVSGLPTHRTPETEPSLFEEDLPDRHGRRSRNGARFNQSF